jgi:Raf kinase inhibitor-like YbhB/YbcL family protein
MRTSIVLFLCLSVSFVCRSCNQANGPADQSDLPGESREIAFPTSSGTFSEFKLSSPAFQDGEPIPSRFSCNGIDRSPPLNWSNVPQDTASLMLVVEDPDAPGGTWVHWIVYSLPVEIRELPEGIGEKTDLGGLGETGTNSWGYRTYGGPCPPSGTHRYIFRLYALDQPLELQPGTAVADLLGAIQGHILGQAVLSGTFSTEK